MDLKNAVELCYTRLFKAETDVEDLVSSVQLDNSKH